MTQRWYQEAVIYGLDVASFQDSNGDGRGDLRGLISRLDYLARVGVTCLWLNPIHPSPGRDNGYDVADFYGVNPDLGSLGDFCELARLARERGIRILLDLVVNHTSDEHPWFVSARSSAESPFRDWYVWSAEEPPNRQQGTVFPGEQSETWTFDEQAQAWYFHRFYDFQPDLNWSNPDVRAEIAKVMAFWLQLGASGFRIDAAPFVLEQVSPGVDAGPQDFSILDSWRQETQWQQGDSVLLCEANVTPQDVAQFTGARRDGPSDRAQMMFDFLLNPRIWLALARSDAEPLIDALTTAVTLPAGAQWATFLRNHDELDLSRLTDEQRGDVFAAFAPREEMRLYGRGIRRRLAPMLGGDLRHIQLAYALQFSLPGTPVLRYGEEIGMGEDLRLDGPRRHSHADAVGRRTERRLLLRRSRVLTPAGRHDRPVRRQAGERPVPTARSHLVAALVREPGAHPAYRSGDRHRHLLRRRRPAAPPRARPPLRRTGRLDSVAAQSRRHARRDRHRPTEGNGWPAVRPAGRRSVRGADGKARPTSVERLGLSMDPARPQRPAVKRRSSGRPRPTSTRRSPRARERTAAPRDSDAVASPMQLSAAP